MNKFEYVSTDGHQMSQERGSLISEIPYLDLGGGWCPGLGEGVLYSKTVRSHVWDGGGTGPGGCKVRSNSSWVMVT